MGHAVDRTEEQQRSVPNFIWRPWTMSEPGSQWNMHFFCAIFWGGIRQSRPYPSLCLMQDWSSFLIPISNIWTVSCSEIRIHQMRCRTAEEEWGMVELRRARARKRLSDRSSSVDFRQTSDASLRAAVVWLSGSRARISTTSGQERGWFTRIVVIKRRMSSGTRWQVRETGDMGDAAAGLRQTVWSQLQVCPSDTEGINCLGFRVHWFCNCKIWFLSCVNQQHLHVRYREFQIDTTWLNKEIISLERSFL